MEGHFGLLLGGVFSSAKRFSTSLFNMTMFHHEIRIYVDLSVQRGPTQVCISSESRVETLRAT